MLHSSLWICDAVTIMQSENPTTHILLCSGAYVTYCKCKTGNLITINNHKNYSQGISGGRLCYVSSSEWQFFLVNKVTYNESVFEYSNWKGKIIYEYIYLYIYICAECVLLEGTFSARSYLALFMTSSHRFNPYDNLARIHISLYLELIITLFINNTW